MVGTKCSGTRSTEGVFNEASSLVSEERWSPPALAFAQVFLAVIAVLTMSKQQITKIGNALSLFTTYLLKVYCCSRNRFCGGMMKLVLPRGYGRFVPVYVYCVSFRRTFVPFLRRELTWT
jgi:hypothetical protein